MFGGCFYFSADRHAFTSRQAGHSTKAGLPAGPHGPLIACRMAAKENKSDITTKGRYNYTDAFCPGLCDTTDGREQQIGRKSVSFLPCVSVFVFWPPIGRLRYTDKTYARSAAGGSGGRSEAEAAYAAGSDTRSTPPGDAEMNATNR